MRMESTFLSFLLETPLRRLTYIEEESFAAGASIGSLSRSGNRSRFRGEGTLRSFGGLIDTKPLSERVLVGVVKVTIGKGFNRKEGYNLLSTPTYSMLFFDKIFIRFFFADQSKANGSSRDDEQTNTALLPNKQQVGHDQDCKKI